MLCKTIVCKKNLNLRIKTYIRIDFNLRYHLEVATPSNPLVVRLICRFRQRKEVRFKGSVGQIVSENNIENFS